MRIIIEKKTEKDKNPYQFLYFNRMEKFKSSIRIFTFSDFHDLIFHLICETNKIV